MHERTCSLTKQTRLSRDIIQLSQKEILGMYQSFKAQLSFNLKPRRTCNWKVRFYSKNYDRKGEGESLLSQVLLASRQQLQMRVIQRKLTMVSKRSSSGAVKHTTIHRIPLVHVTKKSITIRKVYRPNTTRSLHFTKRVHAMSTDVNSPFCRNVMTRLERFNCAMRSIWVPFSPAKCPREMRCAKRLQPLD